MALMAEFVAVVVAMMAIGDLSGANFCPSEPPVRCSCLSEWQQLGNACYRLTSNKHNWGDAKKACRGMEGKMVAPHSLKEMNFMVEMARKVDSQYRIWIACSDEEDEGTWECEGQGSEPFLVWNQGEPNNFGTNQDCATISAHHQDKMDDIHCDHSKLAVCVRQADCTHLPAPPRHYCLSTDTHGRVPNSTCLLDHTIREFITEGVAACGSACTKESGCRSFNIKKTDEGKKICQLNNSTSSEDKDKFQKTDYFCMYSEVCFG